VTARENVNQNSLNDYLMSQNIFLALVKVFRAQFDLALQFSLKFMSCYEDCQRSKVERSAVKRLGIAWDFIQLQKKRIDKSVHLADRRTDRQNNIAGKRRRFCAERFQKPNRTCKGGNRTLFRSARALHKVINITQRKSAIISYSFTEATEGLRQGPHWSYLHPCRSLDTWDRFLLCQRLQATNLEQRT
jgi:hypothetical protein